MKADVLVVGGGTGGTAAAVALAREGVRVVVAEETDWLGGQLTSQCVPPDEHPWIEQCGRTRSYAEYRSRVRQIVRDAGGLTPEAAADPWLNPGGGWVSPLCHEPRHGVAAVQAMLGGSGVDVRHGWRPVAAETQGEYVAAVHFEDRDGLRHTVEPSLVLEATELGDLLELAGAEHFVGADGARFGEPSGGTEDPHDVQGFTWCAIVGHDPDGDHTIERPAQYERWRSYQPSHWPGPLLSLTYRNLATNRPLTFPVFGEEGPTWFGYRQIVDPRLREGPCEAATVLNWPQNDFLEGRVVGEPSEVAAERLEAARQLTLSLVYWLQTEAGCPGVRLRPDLAGTEDGLAMAPYHREGRRMEALLQVREQDVSTACNPGRVVAPLREDSVGVGAYRIDLHPGAAGSPGLDVSSLPFQIPAGMLVPVRIRNLVAAGKCAGTTHITNGCFRLHPVEWGIGEAAGALASFCLRNKMEPKEAVERRLADLQRELVRRGVELDWPRLRAL